MKQQDGFTASYAMVTALVAAAVPLLILPGVFLYFDITPKVIALLMGTALALLAPRAWFGGCTALWRDPFGRIFLTVSAAQLVSVSLSTLFSTQPEISFAGTNWRRFGLIPQAAAISFAAMFTGYLAVHRDGVRPFLRVVAVGGLIASLYGVLQYFGMDPFVAPEAYHIGEGEWTIVRTPGTMGHAGYFATYLVAMIFWAAALGRTESSRGWRIFAYVTSAAGSFAVVLSGTRGAILGLLAGGIVIALWRGPRLNRRVILVAVFAGTVLGAFYFSPPGEKLRARTRWYVEDAAGGGRLSLWRDSLRMFASGPWLTGTGLETFGAQFPRFLSEDLASAYPNRYYESPHNIFVDALTSQGLLGVLVLAALTAIALMAMWRLRKSNFGAGECFAAAFVASLCSNQFLAFTVPTVLYFYFSIGLLVAVSVPALRSEHSSRWIWAVSAPAAAMVLLFLVQFAAVDWRLPVVQREAESGKIAKAIETHKQLARIQPWGMSTDLWFSRLMMAAAQKSTVFEARQRAMSAATAAAERAASRADERQAACYNLAIVYGLQNDAPRAEAALRHAIEVAPAWYKPHWMLAQLLQATGPPREASRQAEQAAKLNGGANAEVTTTRDQLRVIQPAPKE